MDRIKKQNVHLQRHAADVETRFTVLVNDHNKLQQHRNLVLSHLKTCTLNGRRTPDLKIYPNSDGLPCSSGK